MVVASTYSVVPAITTSWAEFTTVTLGGKLRPWTTVHTAAGTVWTWRYVPPAGPGGPGGPGITVTTSITSMPGVRAVATSITSMSGVPLTATTSTVASLSPMTTSMMSWKTSMSLMPTPSSYATGEEQRRREQQRSRRSR